MISDPHGYIHPSALVYGKVSLGEGCSLWPQVVIRAELNQVRVGKYTNIQDFALLHVGWTQDVVIGDYCSITHRVTLHGCTIGNNCLIGIGATVMDGCIIGDNSIIAGHAFLKEGTVIPPNSIVMGMPGAVVKVKDNSVANVANALLYHRNALAYARDEHRAWEKLDWQALLDEAAALLASTLTPSPIVNEEVSIPGV
ncbi:MAG: gamma carbonic anhydrase family protein [Rhodospirillales bacterium]|nr:gamma carbonic anhydrase family protein [Rhodospirillales bacterium]